MDCASYASAERLARIQRESAAALVGDVIDYPFPDLCTGALLRRLSDEFRAPLRSDVPALFIAGSLDARTPEANAREVAATMPNSHVLVIENGPHGIPGHPDLLRVITGFLRGDRVEVTRLRLTPREFAR